MWQNDDDGMACWCSMGGGLLHFHKVTLEERERILEARRREFLRGANNSEDGIIK